MKISRLFTVVAACLVLTADVAVPASAAETGRARTAACEFVPVDDDSGDSIDAPAAVDRFKTPSAVPAKTTAFTSPDGFGGREYILGPSNGRCVAHGGMDQDFDQQITLPGQKTPAFEQVFGAGGDYQLRFGCRYLPTLRQFADKGDCPAPPPTEHVKLLNTGMPTLPAALVTVEPNTSDPQLRTTGTDPVLAVVLAFDLGGDDSDPTYRAVTTSFADCRLSDICIASLQVFVNEAIAFQQRYVDFKTTGNPGRKIRNAIANYKTFPTRPGYAGSVR
ncbi:hypothetical protein Adu01nite_22440 [Paractinoplanes durhamensis]|uniref:Uncharacterized protein n=1 Tax=Paractinoplanes durhamensis TaxID=113563 RepID=A0ABQ3YTS9_9ACTN|nr:hypothetical protein Adu01nite_22440 [Actinoplanes durhamensis]